MNGIDIFNKLATIFVNSLVDSLDELLEKIKFARGKDYLFFLWIASSKLTFSLQGKEKKVKNLVSCT